jgi:hypothetical protein
MLNRKTIVEFKIKWWMILISIILGLYPHSERNFHF